MAAAAAGGYGHHFPVAASAAAAAAAAAAAQHQSQLSPVHRQGSNQADKGDVASPGRAPGNAADSEGNAPTYSDQFNLIKAKKNWASFFCSENVRRQDHPAAAQGP